MGRAVVRSNFSALVRRITVSATIKERKMNNSVKDIVKLMDKGRTNSGGTVAQILLMRDCNNFVGSSASIIAKNAGIEKSAVISTKTVERSMRSMNVNDQIRFVKNGFIINPKTITADNQRAALKAWESA